MREGTTLKEYYGKIIDSLDLNDAQRELLKLTWLDYLLLMNKSARNGWFSYNYSQLIVIFFSLLIPMLEGSRLKGFDYFGLTIISLLSLVVATLTALNRQLGFDAKWRHYRKNAEMMRNEGDDFLALSGNYQNINNHKEAFKSFITTITTFKRQEVSSYLQNDNDKNKNDDKLKTAQQNY